MASRCEIVVFCPPITFNQGGAHAKFYGNARCDCAQSNVLGPRRKRQTLKPIAAYVYCL